MNILILGANGFIGSAVARRLVRDGHALRGIGRDVAAARRRMPAVEWVAADIARLAAPADWTALLAGIDAVVNCAGVLQDGARDDVAALQHTAMVALYEAAGARLVVQVSARTEGAAAATPFLASKRDADRALAASGVPHVILRPALVVGRNAHGGSALLRALAAFPIITPLVRADAPLRFAALDDVAAAVAQALGGGIPSGSDLHVAAPRTLTLAEAVGRHRAWLGLPPARVLHVPAVAARAVSLAADLLGRLGWRSPLRSTAMKVMEEGVTIPGGEAVLPAGSLEEALAANPAGVQDLWFARLYLMKPVIIGTLGLFWLLSGLIALVRLDAAAAHLVTAGLSSASADVLTIATALADIVLGAAVLLRRHAGWALKGMVALSLAYLAGATMLLPLLWADPLGPLVKVLPSIVLAIVALAVLDER